MIIVGFCVGQIAALLQLAWPALLLLAGSGAAARKGRSWVRHFAMPFASTVVNAANADHAPRCVCVAPHGCVLCTWLCGIHCVPRRGATALLGMQHGQARIAAAAAADAAAWALPTMACGRVCTLVSAHSHGARHGTRLPLLPISHTCARARACACCL